MALARRKLIYIIAAILLSQVILVCSSWNWISVHYYKRGLRQTGPGRQKAEEALIRLGYYERRSFALKNRILSKEAYREFAGLVSKARFQDIWSISTRFDTSTLTVTAARKDMPEWERVVAEFDAKKDL